MTKKSAKPAGAEDTGRAQGDRASATPARIPNNESAAVEQFLAEKAETIRALERDGKRVVFKVACEIGQHLSNVRDYLSRNSSGDGTWIAWLGREFPYWGSQRTAYNYIGTFQFVQRHGGQVATFANSIDLSAVYLLAAPSTPEDVRTEVLDRAEAGEKISRQSVRDSIDEHKPSLKLPPDVDKQYRDVDRKPAERATFNRTNEHT